MIIDWNLMSYIVAILVAGIILCLVISIYITQKIQQPRRKISLKLLVCSRKGELLKELENE